MKGIYKQVGAIIRKKKELSPVINAQNIKSQIDISKLDPEEIVEEWKSFVIAIAMAENGLRASVRGEGLYIDAQNIRNSKVIEVILDNLGGDIASRKKKKEELLRLINEGTAGSTPGQGVWIPIGLELNLTEESSDAEIISELRRVAV